MKTAQLTAEILAHPDWNQAKLAERLGVSQGSISRWKKGTDPEGPSQVALRDLHASIFKAGETPAPARASEVRTADVALPAIGNLPRDVPVLGTAAGSDYERGAFQLSTDPVDYVRRPPALLANTAVYALYVEGSSMEPKYEPGELIYVNPARPVRPGDFVVVQEMIGEDDTRRGFVKQYVKRAGEWHMVRQFNPPAELRFPANETTRVHKVLSTSDLLGM